MKHMEQTHQQTLDPVEHIIKKKNKRCIPFIEPQRTYVVYTIGIHRFKICKILTYTLLT